MTSTEKAKKKAFWRNSPLPFAIAFALSVAPVWAQEDAVEEAAEDVIEAAEEAVDEAAADMDAIVVTGSRLQRETYSSIAPMQIITAERSREAGLVDTAEILQKSSFSAGQQIDLSFNGFVLDNGPGSSTVNLRGLGDARTLLLMNGRRLAPSGVEGAPSAPDLNLIPAALVQQYEILLDGASSIYGSDAVAGVVNVIMKRDFDGLEIDVTGSSPTTSSAGDTYDLSLTWGKNFDRGFVGFGASYRDIESISRQQGAFTSGCNQHQEIDENGVRRTGEVFYTQVYGMEWDECNLGSLASRVSVPFQGSIYYTPGVSNGGWGNFSESSQFGFGIDSNGDGVADLSFRDYDNNGKDNDRHLIPESDMFNAMAYGEYTFDGDMNNTPYFEVNFADRTTYILSGTPQLFPDVPGSNPFNLCNPDAENGVDCGLAVDGLRNNQGYLNQVCATFGIPSEFCTAAIFGAPIGEIGPADTLPIVRVAGDRNNTSIDMQQLRAVVGMKGDLPFIDFGPVNNWVYDLSFSWTESDGTSSRRGIRGDRLDYSLTTSRVGAGGNIICGDNDGCVPINMFAPSLYPVGDNIIGDFATQAERDYLFDSRDFRTKYTQTIASGYVNGFLGNLPGGPIMAGFGFELRNDDIASIPDDIANDGLFFGFFSDGGADGDKDTTEFFGEIELPILSGVTGAEELVLNLSARYTDDEFYGSDTTGSAKLGWRPVSSLLLRATYGTSFRAPTVREVFLRDQSGFNTLFDPCVIPEVARGGINGEYDPALDPREPETLQNCVNNGVDPTTLDNNGFASYSVEINRGGSLNLDAETSESFTYGFSFEQPWFDTFDLTFGATYYDIEVEDTIIEPSAQFLVNDCYGDLELDSNFCQQLHRDSDGFLDLVSAGFVNRDNQTVRGIDINMNYDKFFTLLGGQGMNFSIDLNLNHPLEASTTFVDDDGAVNFDDDAGEWGFQDWKGQLGFRAEINNWTYAWFVNYISDTDQDVDGIDDFDEGINGFSDTCIGPPTDVLCRDIGFGDDYWTHTASVAYTNDNWAVRGGVRNLFNQAPPLVDGTEVLAVNNVPIGYGYDLFGRTLFINVSWRQ